MTLEEIATELGMSKSTVSRALSGKGRVSQKTRDYVKEFVELHGGLRKNKIKKENCTHNIGVVLPVAMYYGEGAYFQSCLLGICESAAMYGYNVLITPEKIYDISGIEMLVENKRIDGMILTRSLKDDRVVQYLKKANFPTAITGYSEYDEIIQVDTDNEGAAEEMTMFLINRGFRKFALLVKDLNFIVDRQRYNGFNKALLKNGISEKNQIFYSVPLKVELLDSIISNIISQKVECVICGDDQICTMIMSRLQADGYRIPRDIAIASLYNSTNLDCYSPAVTAVNVAASRMGNMAGKQLIQYLMGRSYEKRTIIDYDILFRKSTN